MLCCYLRTYKNLELIFVDNGSVDGSVSSVRSNFPQVKIIALKENLGLLSFVIWLHGKPREYLFFYNNDTIVLIKI